MWNTLTAFFSAIGKALGLVTQRDAEKNAADVKAAASAAAEQNQVDAANKAIAKGDITQIRDDLAE